MATVRLQKTLITGLIGLEPAPEASQNAPLSINYQSDLAAVHVVDMIYAPSYTQQNALPVPVFIMAFNWNTVQTTYRCGIAIFGVDGTSYSTIDMCLTQVYVDPASPIQTQPYRTAINSISAITTLLNPNHVTLLVVYADFPTVVYQTTLVQGSDPTVTPILTQLQEFVKSSSEGQIGTIRAMYASTGSPNILGLVE